MERNSANIGHDAQNLDYWRDQHELRAPLQPFQRARQSDDWLKLSLDRKVSPQGWYQIKDKRWVPTVPNGFGLPPVDSCPGSTESCEAICYAINSERADGVASLLRHNQNMLEDAESVYDKTLLLTEAVNRYQDHANKKDVPADDRIFRIHWSGDFYSEDYAEAWANTVHAFPDIAFWTYTRSFVEPVDVVSKLYGIDNLALYLSVDENNIDAAREVTKNYPDILWAPTAEFQDEAQAMMPEGQRSVPCPENLGKLALMDERGGACVTCGVCPKARRSVTFFDKPGMRSFVQQTLEVTPVQIKQPVVR